MIIVGMSDRDREDTRIEQLDILSAIWILSSNDENPEISYRGIRYRLRLAANIDERRLVADRGELFRTSIPQSRLDEIKLRYSRGQRLPSWLRAIPEAERPGITAD
jgi:hypothetical protein